MRDRLVFALVLLLTGAICAGTVRSQLLAQQAGTFRELARIGGVPIYVGSGGRAFVPIGPPSAVASPEQTVLVADQISYDNENGTAEAVGKVTVTVTLPDGSSVVLRADRITLEPGERTDQLTFELGE